MAYTDATEMLSLVRDLTSVIDRDTIIQRKLSDSAGKDPSGVTTYRPYFVSAKLLQQNRPDQLLNSADGVKFSNLVTMIESLMNEQQSLDNALNLTVPPGFAAVLDPGAVVMSIMST